MTTMTDLQLRPTAHSARGLACLRRGLACRLIGVLMASGALGRGEAGAATSLSRGAALARALEQNPQIAASRAVEAQAEARRAQAWAARLPSVTLTAGVGPALKARLVPGSATGSTESAYDDLGLDDLSVVFGGRLDVLQPLYTFGKISERLRATELELGARRAQTDMTRAELALSVARLYEGFLLARDALRFFDDNERWLTRTIEHARGELAADAGATEEDLLRLQTALGVSRLGKSQATAGLKQAHAGLVALLGYAAGTELEPQESALELLPSGLDGERALIELGLRERPELRALALGSAAFGALSNAERADELPDLFALGFVSGAYTPGRDLVESRFAVDPLNHFVPGLLLGARWVISGSRASERSAETRARGSELDHTKEWARLAIPAEIAKVFEDLERAKRDAAEAEQAALLAKKWLVRAGAEFFVGVADSRSVGEASDAFGRLCLAGLDARFRHNVALAELARATGTLSPGSSRFYPTR
jgi:outer membrane protein